VLERGGEVLKFIGDGLLAIFPMDQMNPCDTDREMVYCATSKAEDCATEEPNLFCGKSACARAIEAARDAVKRMADANEEIIAGGQEALRFGLALHLGNVTYGNIGASSRLDFTVIGPATNEAARMDSLTKELGIAVLMSEELERFVTGTLASVGRHSLRVVSADREIFTLPELVVTPAE
jgi:adenylate cyclase